MVVGRQSFVSSFRQQISLLNCLRRGQKKRQNRQKSCRLTSSYSTVEHLEDRTLLAGASLVNIEPNIDLSLTEGEVYNEAPNELTFKFTPGQQIDAASLGGIQFVRSGLDGTFNDGNEVVIQPGYIGIGDNANEVIVRFAESLPDDNYQITIFGTGVTPLLNQNGEAFQDGVDQVINFELDLGAKVVAVVPQPVSGGGTGSLTQALNQIDVYFNDDPLDQTSAENTLFYQLIDTTTNVIVNPASVTYDVSENKAVLTFATDIANGTYHLRIGEEATPNFAASNVVSVADDDNSSFDTAFDLGILTTQTIQINEAITPQAIAQPQLPGGNDEPGHREITIEQHIGETGTDPSVFLGVPTITFSFPETYGTDLFGNTLYNEITENQKQRTREIYETYSFLTGIEVQEVASGGTGIVTGDIRVLAPGTPPLAAAGIAGGGLAIMNGALDWGDSPYGGGWFVTAFHEIGHTLGLGHSYDLPSIMGSSGGDVGGTTAGEPIFPSNYDIVHINRIHPALSNDIDLHKFELTASGRFTAEITADRLPTKSFLDSVLTLYREAPGGVREIIARNDDYFGEDAFLDLDLEAGTYYLAITSVGNTEFDPTVSDSGYGGRTDGDYTLDINFTPDPLTNTFMVDATGIALDGDADGTPGGVFDFWFQSGETIFVDKATQSGGPANGSLTNPYSNIDDALSAAASSGTTKIVRIVGNGGTDNDISTVGDNEAYLIGLSDSFQPLEDGATFEIPQNVTVMVDQGAIIKLQKANIDVGSNNLLVDRSQGALQILGTPDNQVHLTAYGNDAIGGDDDGLSDGANAGDWGGIVFRADSDLEDSGVFLNSVNNASISYGGGSVFVNSVLQIFSPIHAESSRPTIWQNTIFNNADSAISADPRSFEDSRFENGSFIKDRYGLEIFDNYIFDNSVNGLFVRINTAFGNTINKLDVPGIFNDDITHVITENLQIYGAPGGQLDADGNSTINGRLKIDPGIVVKLSGARIEAERGSAQLIAEGTEENPIIFTSLSDDRYGAGTTFDTSNDGVTAFGPGNWGGIILNAASSGSIDHALITNAGGLVPIEGGFANFNAIEVHQAEFRIANSILENNASGQTGSNRNGRGSNDSATIFVRGAQPIIVDNIFQDNIDGTVVSIDANALNYKFKTDYGRSTGFTDAYQQFTDNHGALVRLNRMENNGLNGMEVRAALLDTETIWDDTDIVHILRGEIQVNQHHTFSGVRLQSNLDEGLVVKLAGPTAGFTADGVPLDIDDRIGGTVQIIGQPGFPVVLTSLADDTVGASFTPAGTPQTDTNNDGNASTPAAGDWRSIRLDRYSNDRNVVVRFETEGNNTSGVDTNSNPGFAQNLGELAPDEISGDENRALGFEVHGNISADAPDDVDVYSFNATAGTRIWIDIDRTSSSLNTMVELVDIFGNVIASSLDSFAGTFTGSADPLLQTPHLLGDFYSQNIGDAGFSVMLPDPFGTGAVGTFFVRVRSQPVAGDEANVTGGQTSGQYQLQIRLRQVDEKPGSTVRYADIRYPTNGVEILGLPAHSPLLGESSEKQDASEDPNLEHNDTIDNAQGLGNLLTSDRNTLSVSGTLENGSDVDWYTFEMGYDLIQVIGGRSNGAKTFSTIFDIDYADGLTRADTTISVFDNQGRLILVSRDSDIADDQANGDTEDLTSGSFGKLDPYIGTVQLPTANPGSTFRYHVAISSNARLPQALDATFTSNALNTQIRLEPVSSVQRIVEDHIGFSGYTTGNSLTGQDLVVPTVSNGIFDISNTTTLSTNITAFSLEDVNLYVSRDTGTGINDQLIIVDPYDGDVADAISGTNSTIFVGNLSDQTRDITIRSDGELYSYGNLPGNGGSVGVYKELNPGNASTISSDNDGIPGIPNTGQTDQVQVNSDSVGALAFQRIGVANYNLFYAVNDGSNTTLYQGNPANGDAGDNRRVSATDFTDARNRFTVIGDVNGLGNITGMSFRGINATDSQDILYAVTDDGLFLTITFTTQGWGRRDVNNFTVTNDLSGQIDGTFAGLTVAPQNLNNGAFRNFLFAITDTGNLYAIDPATGSILTHVTDTGLPGGTDNVEIFEGGVDHINVGVSSGITGLAFSPLDFNLWHPTFQRNDIDNPGHGINGTFDDTRNDPGGSGRAAVNTLGPAQFPNGLAQTESQGGASFYFGFEEWSNNTPDNQEYIRYGVDAQYGVISQAFQRDLSTNNEIGDNYNIAGGAHGSLESTSFSLDGYSSTDKPTLYFNYFLETENANDIDRNLMRDAARVFISSDGGNSWSQLATNNSQPASDRNPDRGELSNYITTSERENGPGNANGRVQEMFDNSGVWRQARVDLGSFAGLSNLTLRFDFSTSGTINADLSAMGGTMPGDEFGDPDRNLQAQNNNFEGFYIDDIIIGFAERGEMVTNAQANQTAFFDLEQNEAFGAPTQLLSGAYQLEIRRGTDYASPPSGLRSDLIIGSQFDTNDQLIREDGQLGDRNLIRQQGHISIESNTITNASEYGINIDTGQRELVGAGRTGFSLRSQAGGVINGPELNDFFDSNDVFDTDFGYAPGVIIQNNVITDFSNGDGGIRISGDDNSNPANNPAAVSYTKVVNNTLVGDRTGGELGQGILVENYATTTILNNIIAFTETGIDLQSAAGIPNVVGANLFKGNSDNGTMGSNPIDLKSAETLFVNAASGNFYLANNSKAIDSSLNNLSDRLDFVNVKDAIGMPNSDIFSPAYDAFGQLRVDDPTQTPPPGLGSNIFKDRGAIERADFVGPTASITLPADNDVAGVDLNPVATEVYIADPELFTTMIIKLSDTGIGIDDSLVNSSQFTLTAKTSSTQRILEEGTDYFFSYNSNTNEAIFTSIAVFSLDTLYTIDVDNSDLTGIQDLAGNSLQPNQNDLTTSFTIVVTDGTNDAPLNHFDGTPIPGAPNLSVTTDPGQSIVFSSANGNALTVTDEDSFLGVQGITTTPATDGTITVTLSTPMIQGKLTAGPNTDNVVINLTNDGTDNILEITGLIEDVNTALDGVEWTPLSTPTDPLTFADGTATLTMTTDDHGNFFGNPSATDIDIIDIVVTPLPEIFFASSTYDVNEDGTTTVTVQLERDKIGLITDVDLLFGAGTTEAADFVTPPPSQVTFAADQFTVEIVYVIDDDEIVEQDEEFTLTIDTVTNGTKTDGSVPDGLGGTVTVFDQTTVTIIDNDTATITFVNDNLSVTEESGSVIFEVQISNAVAEDVSFDLSTIDGASLVDRNATDENFDNDYTSKSENRIFSASIIPASNLFFEVFITDDTKLELDEVFNVFMDNLFANGLESKITLDDPAQATILDDTDVAEISFTDDNLFVNEEDGTVTFIVQISNAIAEDVSFDISTQDGTSMTMRNATDQNTDDDYTSKTESFTFLGTQDSDPDVVPGTQDFVVTIINDDKLELDEVFNVFMSNLNANGLNDRTERITFASPELAPAQATIIDDSDVAEISFIEDTLIVNEEDGSVIFTVQISNAIAEDVSFDISTQDGASVTIQNNATDENADDDYTSKTETKTFLGTQDTDLTPSTQNFVVTITNDDKLELDEVFNVFMSNLDANQLNDRVQRITFGSPLVSPAQVTILDDSDTATISFVDDDISVNEEDGSVTFAVQISNAIAVDVSLVLSTQDGSSVTMRNATDENSDNDYTASTETITFTGTVNSDPDLVPGTEEFIVTITNDTKLELDEVFDVFMSSLNANGLNDRSERITYDTVTPAQATILDDTDVAEISFTDDNLFVNEEDGTVTFIVQISNAIAEDVSFDISTQDGTSMTMRNATDQNTDDDYTSKTESFTFLGTQDSDPDVVPGTQDFVVTIINDDKLELDEVFNVFMSNLNANGLNDRTERITFASPELAPAQATIIDDSDVAEISFTNDDLTVNEEGTVAFFTVWISNAIAENVSFDLFTQDGTSVTMRNATDENIDDDYTSKTETKTFLGTQDTDLVPGIQTFIISITNDDKLELDEVFNVLMDNLVANGLESRITLDDPAQVTIVDDSDTATISFVQNDVHIIEEDGSVTFSIQISNAIAEDVNFDLTTRDGASPVPVGSGAATNELLDNDYEFKTQNFTFVGTPNTDNLPGTQNFTVTITNDDKVELDELFNVFIDNLNANGLDSRITLGSAATGIIRNNDSAVITVDPVEVVGKDEGTGSSTTSFVFNVNISNAVDTDVSFNVSTQDNTATVADNDYIPVIDQFFTFLGSSNSDVVPGQQTFTVQIPQDNKVELDEIFDVILTNLNSMGRNVTFGPVAHGTIINDDSATISINNVSQLEADGEFFFTATISNPVDTNISVEVYTEHSSLLITDNDYNVVAPTSPIILNFTPTGALTQNFTITVNDDNIVEGDEFFSTILANLDNALRDVSILNGTNQGHIQDDDSATLSISPVTDTENNSPFQFLVELSNPVDVAITVDASTIDGSAFAPSDYQAIVNQLLTFNPGITQLPVNVTVTNDATTEAPETFEVILENLNPNGRAVFLTSIAARSNSATSDAAVAVDVVGDFAYIADRDGGLQIFNIADPSNPFHVGEYDFNLQGIAQGIDVVGNLAYMAVGEAGLQILDISDPTNPTFVGSIATPARARGVEVIGNLAYVADDSGNGGGLQIIDVTDPTNPTSVGSFGVSTPGGLAGGVKVIGNIAYVTDGNNGLQIVDVSVPATPVQILNVPTPGGAAIGLDVVGNFAYVANREGGLQVIDISNPATASIVGTLDTPGIATGVRVVGNFAYVADGTVGLQVVDITNPLSPTIARTHNTPGGARSLFVQGTLAYVADTFNGLEILEFFPSTSATGTILDPSGPPLTGTASANTKINTSLVLNATTTDANGETAAVPESEQWIDEWDSFWVEVWGNTSVGSGISGGTFDLEYNTDYFTATAVEYGTAFGNSTTSTIDDQTGTVSGISGQNNLGTLGSGNQVLLARIKFESTEEDGVAIDQQTGFLGPHSLGIKVSNAQLDVTDYGGVTASIADSPETDLWAVPFDLDDNGAVNFRDLVSFVSFYGTSVFDSSSGLAWSLDFDKNGQINFRDLTYLINNYGLTKASGQQVAFPPNFPQEWYGSSITTEGEDSLDVLIEAAVNEWKTATGNEELAVQVVVTDLGGQQLGEGHILELDENGIPIKGRVYIDDDAAGLGWYSSVEGLSFDSNGQAIADSAAVGHYDLYTVLLHEIGHAAGFTTSYSAFTDHVVNNGPGQVQFVGWDFVAPLTDDGLHIDESYSPNDVLGATLDPSTRKMISSLDVRILQAAYENASGASITPLAAPLMAADETSTNNSTTTSSAEAAFASTAISQTGSAPVDKQEYPAKSVLQPEWSYAQPQLVQNSIMSIEQSTNLDQLAGSLIDVSYETEQYLTDEFGKIKTEESAFRFDFAHEFEMEDIVENDVVDEELDSLFTEWAGPLV